MSASCPNCNHAPDVRNTGCGWQANCPSCFEGDPEQPFSVTEIVGTGETRGDAIEAWNRNVSEWLEDNAS